MSTKKTAAKKTATKKTATKKTATKKTATKKTATKKTATKKTATKKTAVKKTAVKKTVTKKQEPTVTTAPTIGAAAPAFSLPGDDGELHSLAAYAGKAVVVYFYPRDDTPGCTTEACDFRDNMARLTAKGAVVLGVSRDTLKSHAKFKTKHSLNFTLLSDEELAMHRAYNAWGTKNMYGKEVEGTIRSTFLIDGKGVLRAAWTKVKVAGHVDAVLTALEAL
jgi:peroxiredoxin Q/BCP